MVNGRTDVLTVEMDKDFLPNLNFFHHITSENCERMKGCESIAPLPQKSPDKMTNNINPRIFHELMLTQQSDDSHLCHICGKGFADNHVLQQHLRLHVYQPRSSSRKKHTCKWCVKTFALETSLRQHLFTHKEDVFECKVCEKIFDSKVDLHKHMSTHSEETSDTCSPTHHVCSICSKSYIKQQNLQRHVLREHTNKSPPRNGEDRASLNRTNIVEKLPYDCSLCEKSYNQKQKLKNHVRRAHPEYEEDKSLQRTHCDEDTLACGICWNSFSHLNKLTRHVLQDHANECPPEYEVDDALQIQTLHTHGEEGDNEVVPGVVYIKVEIEGEEIDTISI